MALKTRYVGSGLGLKPISIGEDPYKTDSEFDSTVRIPVTTTKKAPSVPASVAAAPVTTQPPGQPQVQPPMPPPAPPTITQGYPGLDPSQLNYEGSTFQPSAPPTMTTTAPDLTEVERLLIDFKQFTGMHTPGDWKERLTSDPEGFLSDALEAKNAAQKRAGKDSDKQRLIDWYINLEKAVRKQGQAPNAEYGIQYKQQEMFNQSLERLKLAGAAGAREQDEELMAMLASRGLLDSGIAAREVTRLQEQRNKNYYDAVNQLNQMILQGDISRLTARDLATLEADLQKRNAEALLRIQQQFAKQNQPSGIAQIIGTAAGTALPFLLGGGGSSGTNAAPSTTRLYGEQPGSTYRRPPESIL